MTVTGFWLDQAMNANVGDILYQSIKTPTGTQFTIGDACIVSTSTTTSGPNSTYTAGLLIQCATQASYVPYIFDTLVTPSAELRQATYNLSDSYFENAMVIPTANELVFGTQIPTGSVLYTSVPFDSGINCNANSTANQVLVTMTGSTNDFNGGTLYCNETNTQYTIINDTVSGGVHTFTIAPPAKVALTTGNTLRLLPYGAGYIGGVKLGNSVTNPYAGNWQGISSAVADKTGGHVIIRSVNMQLRTVYVYFSQLQI
jgi:hypothetical protein